MYGIDKHPFDQAILFVGVLINTHDCWQSPAALCCGIKHDANGQHDELSSGVQYSNDHVTPQIAARTCIHFTQYKAN